MNQKTFFVARSTILYWCLAREKKVWPPLVYNMKLNLIHVATLFFLATWLSRDTVKTSFIQGLTIHHVKTGEAVLKVSEPIAAFSLLTTFQAIFFGWNVNLDVQKFSFTFSCWKKDRTISLINVIKSLDYFTVILKKN